MSCLNNAILLTSLMLLCAAKSNGQAVSAVSSLLTFRESGKISREYAAAVNSTSGGESVKGKTALMKVACGDGAATSMLLGRLCSARLGENSAIQVPEAAGDSSSLELLKGRLFLHVDAHELAKRGKGEFRLKTPSALLTVRGTKFFVISTEAGDVVGVLEGEVSVRDSRGRNATPVPAGSAVEVAADVISAPRPLSDEEQGYSTQVEEAAVVRTPLALVLERPFDQRRGEQASAVIHWRGKTMELNPQTYANFKTRADVGPYVRLQGWAGEVPTLSDRAAATVPKPTLGEVGVRLQPDGMVNYSWNWSRNGDPERNVTPQAGSLAVFDFYPHDFGQNSLGECLGIEFQASGTGIDQVTASTGSGSFIIPMPKNQRIEDIVARPPDMTLEAAVLSMGKRNDLERGMITLKAYPQTTAAATASTKDDLASFSLGDFVLVTLPR